MLCDYVRLHMDHAAQRVSSADESAPDGALDAATAAEPSAEPPLLGTLSAPPSDASRAAVAMAPDEARDPGVDFDALVAVCLEVCVSVQRLDTLFGPVYAMLRPSALARRAFAPGAVDELAPQKGALNAPRKQLECASIASGGALCARLECRSRPP